MNTIITIKNTPAEMGLSAAERIASLLNAAIARQGYARLVLSTGASQFETLDALIHQPVDWSKVEMFHLDEYVALPESHPASFRKYLKERFVSKVNLKAAHFVEGDGDVSACIARLTRELREKPVDVGVIGIGENGHIAFNDPPADFHTKEAYIVVNLDDRCKHQQVGEGWFATPDDVPKQAISMTVPQILSCRAIVSCVPHAVKQDAVQKTLQLAVSPNVPATVLKTHPEWYLYLDTASAAKAFGL